MEVADMEAAATSVAVTSVVATLVVAIWLGAPMSLTILGLVRPHTLVVHLDTTSLAAISTAAVDLSARTGTTVHVGRMITTTTIPTIVIE